MRGFLFCDLGGLGFGGGPGEPGRRNLVPYWLAILEDLTKTG